MSREQAFCLITSQRLYKNGRGHLFSTRVTQDVHPSVCNWFIRASVFVVVHRCTGYTCVRDINSCPLTTNILLQSATSLLSLFKVPF